MAARRKATRKRAKRARAKGTAEARAGRKRARAKPRAARKRGAARPAQKPRARRKSATAATLTARRLQRAEPGARPSEAPSHAAPDATLRVVSAAPVLIASVLRYYGRAGAAALALEGALALGDWIHVRGATSDFVQRVASLRAGGQAAKRAESGEVSVQLAERARPGDRVFVLRPAP